MHFSSFLHLHYPSTHVPTWTQAVTCMTERIISLSLLLLFSYSVVTNSLWPHGLQHARLPYSSLSHGVCSNSCPLSWWCHPTISSCVVPFSSCRQFFPASGSFPVSQLFVSGGQSTGASALASLLLKNIQGWFPLEVTGLISLLSKGLLRIFSGTTFRKHQFFGAHPKSSSKLTQLVTLASLGIPHLELYDPNPLENSLDFFVFALTYLEHSFTTYCYTSPTMLHTQTWLNYNTQLDHQLDIFYVTRLPSLPIRLCHSINWPHNVQFSVSTSICLFIFVCVCVCVWPHLGACRILVPNQRLNPHPLK